MLTRRLIITADDLGATAARSHGIFSILEQGMVKSASLLPNFFESDKCLERARHRNVPLGLQFNLTAGSPLCKEEDVASLLDGNGYFRGSKGLRSALERGEVAKEHLERELRAQLTWFTEGKLHPTHICSAHHVHVHPHILRVLLEILPDFGLCTLRLPYDPTPLDSVETESQRAWMTLVNAEAQAAKALLDSHQFLYTEHFLGLAFEGNVSLRAFRNLISKLPDGTTEIMLHPGLCTPDGDVFDRDPQRETELRMLMDEKLPFFIRQCGVEVVGYENLMGG